MHVVLRARSLAAAATVILGVSACSTFQSPQGQTAEVPALQGWSARALPGKQATRYSVAQRGGRPCVLAQAQNSVSLWRREVAVPAGDISRIEFDWWITRQSRLSSVAQAHSDDAAARIVLGFEGDEARLPLRNRMQFDLVRTLTGESPPFATLMYVWDAQAEPETLIVSSRSDRVRKIVVGRGDGAQGRWQRISRDLQADFVRAYGEAPGRLISLAMMTDADNTASQTEACYGGIRLFDKQGSLLEGSLNF